MADGHFESLAGTTISNMSHNRFRRWIACLVLLAPGVALLPAAESQSPAGATNPSLSVNASSKRAGWQQRLTLGPGDLLNLQLFGVEDTAKTEVPVGPDGRISFLQARDILATGLTIDELRGKLDEALAKYYPNPRTIIIPAAFRSKKYIVLGAVATKGVFTFDRPLTVIEAIARAGGLESGLYAARTVEMADLQRSFLMRNGQRVPVDFEGLFQRGDLAQNVALQPDDYLYFASASANEIYVLGEVMFPGIQVFAAKPTAVSAVTFCGGFTPRAFQSRVLVVRGSLEQPQTFVVDTAAILAGKAPDFRLQPRDIVYVGRNPWVVAAEIVDMAAKAFVQSALVSATGKWVAPTTK
jgi:protein involved in polysaccharide export with SLBB domain